jgi:hypothetical protein
VLVPRILAVLRLPIDPLGAICELRHKIIHKNAQVDLTVVRDTGTNDLAPLIPSVEALLNLRSQPTVALHLTQAEKRPSLTAPVPFISLPNRTLVYNPLPGTSGGSDADREPARSTAGFCRPDTTASPHFIGRRSTMAWHRDSRTGRSLREEVVTVFAAVVPSPTSACMHSRNYVWRSRRVAPDSLCEWNRMDA